MLNTISLSGHLMTRAKQQSAHGMERSAFRTLDTLASFGNLRADTSAEARGLLAELSLRMGRFRAARRHAAAALASAPSCPHYQYLCGRAWEKGIGADLQAAANSYLACLDSQPDHVQARCALGLLRVSTGMVNEGIAILSEAWRSHPNHYDVFLALFRAYRRAGRSAEARAHFAEARFRLKNDRRFQVLCDKISYSKAVKQQSRGGKGEKTILPFLRIADPVAPLIGERLPSTTIRIDGPGAVQEPHSFRLRRHLRGRNA